MHRPVLVTPPVALPVTLDEMKLALRVDHDDDDDRITGEIASAVAHYEGWTGMLGCCLAEQTWRQGFDRFERQLLLALGPVRSIASISWRSREGHSTTLSNDDYVLVTDAGGRSCVRFHDSASLPSGPSGLAEIAEIAAIAVDYVAGWPFDDTESTVPPDVKTAIKLRVQMVYDEAASPDAQHLIRAEAALVAKYRRIWL